MGLIRFSEFVSNLRVNSKAAKVSFFARRTGIVKNVLNVLYKEGFISGFFAEDSRQLSISLKYFNNRPVINKVKIITRPGHSVFYSRAQMFRNFGPFSPETFIFSTDKGIISNRVSHELSLDRANVSFNNGLAPRFQLMPNYYFIELHGYTFYELNFFTYKGCFDPISENNLRVNAKFISFFDENARLFFYSFSDKNLRSFPSRFYSFLARFIPDYNFVTCSSFSGVGSFFKFIVSFLLNFSKYFSTGFLATVSNNSVSFDDVKQLMKNFLFVCLDILDSTLLVSPVVSSAIHYNKPKVFSINQDTSALDGGFGTGANFFRKNLVNNIKTVVINSGFMPRDYSQELPFYSAFYANIKSGLFSSLHNPLNLRGIPDFFFRMSLGFRILGNGLFFSFLFPAYVTLFRRTASPFFRSFYVPGSIDGLDASSLFGLYGGRNLSLLPLLFYFCRAFEDCVEILVKLGLVGCGNAGSRVNVFREGGPLLIRVF